MRFYVFGLLYLLAAPFSILAEGDLGTYDDGTSSCTDERSILISTQEPVYGTLITEGVMEMDLEFEDLGDIALSPQYFNSWLIPGLNALKNVSDPLGNFTHTSFDEDNSSLDVHYDLLKPLTIRDITFPCTLDDVMRLNNHLSFTINLADSNAAVKSAYVDFHAVRLDDLTTKVSFTASFTYRKLVRWVLDLDGYSENMNKRISSSLLYLLDFARNFAEADQSSQFSREAYN
ncbi:MAG: hypothetical protein K9L24_03855 [Spirochaetia bacterium]|nr:hypothetical protein [Spirochaetia bacterium]MCF7953132.1 hypothetical protein [Spirochaetales bacterium]